MRESRPSASGRARPFNPAPLAPLPLTGAADPFVSQDAAHAHDEEVRYPLSLNILAGAGEALLCSA